MLLEPDPGWYYSRLVDAQRIGIDRYTIADVTSFINQAGWQNPSRTSYAFYVVAITYLRKQRPEEAAHYMDDVIAHMPPTSWEASIAQFLEGNLTASALLSKASTPGLQTEAHAYIGIKAHIDGDNPAALTHLQWVKDKGVKSYTEYGLSLGELDRMEREK